jgi:CHASE2 domain-containing sensor protein
LGGDKDGMRKANEARLYAATTTAACLLALLAGVVGAPTRAVIQQWPWPRERLGELVNKLKNAGAAAIAFDFLFSEKDRADAAAKAGQTPDDEFARAIDGAPVILGACPDSFWREW